MISDGELSALYHLPGVSTTIFCYEKIAVSDIVHCSVQVGTHIANFGRNENVFCCDTFGFYHVTPKLHGHFILVVVPLYYACGTLILSDK